METKHFNKSRGNLVRGLDAHVSHWRQIWEGRWLKVKRGNSVVSKQEAEQAVKCHDILDDT